MCRAAPPESGAALQAIALAPVRADDNRWRAGLRTGTVSIRVTKIPLKPASAALALVTAALLAACGSTTVRTVTVTKTQTVAANTSSSSQTATSSSSTSTTTSTSTSAAQTQTSTGPSATSTTQTTTRTSTGPAFVSPNPTPTGALGAAVALLARKGYTPVDTSSYDAGDTLRVLIGRASGGERAFFFVDGRYLGTDAAAASAHVTVFAHSDTEAVLRYSTYAPGAATASGTRLVHFALDMGQLNAIDPIPSVSVRR